MRSIRGGPAIPAAYQNSHESNPRICNQPDSHTTLKFAPHPDASDEQHASTSQVPLIYLAGPYTETDPVENTHRMIRIADALLDAGFTPLVPHLTLAWHLVSPKPYTTWLTYDRHLLARCDVLLRVPGYSHGATQECTFADELGIPVIRPRTADPDDCVAAVTHFFSN